MKRNAGLIFSLSLGIAAWVVIASGLVHASTHIVIEDGSAAALKSVSVSENGGLLLKSAAGGPVRRPPMIYEDYEGIRTMLA